MLARRMLLLIALLMGLAALAAVIAPAPDEPAPAPQRSDQGSAPLSPTPATPADEEERDLAAISGEPAVQTLDAARSGQIVRVAIDERVRLRVRSTQLDSVQLGRDGPIEIVTPEAPARFELLVDAPLDLEVRLLEADRVIGRVTTDG